ncbi:MAG: hypothetical protein U5N58_10515 [Actinomycetota bacterium]|nr:hypothetical protein [Actinomycetota bacterium]
MILRATLQQGANQYRYWENTINRIEMQKNRLDNLKELIWSKVNIFSTLGQYV